jgi:MoaA/NifB/PqqE/SkfB family radical SAM enzyme
MLPELVARIVSTTHPRCLGKFVWNFGVKTLWGMERFKARLRRGEYFPAFLYISILNSCNLRCQGCWVDVEAERSQLDVEAVSRLIDEAKTQGNRFFGLLGGEPFLHPGLLEILERHPECYFQIFTNGQCITPKIAARLSELGNATPLVSVEGREIVSNQRRGNVDVLARTLRGLDACLDAGLITGVATSVCQTNITELLTENWLQELIDRGVHYAWYHTYRPVGPKMNPQLGLTPDQLVQVRRFVVEMRAKMPIGIVDAYYGHDGKALCPMSTGISHHISPYGDVEPCPIIQFAKEDIRDERGIVATIRDSAFLKDFRELSAEATRGCVVLERPDLVRDLVRKHGARDTTVRGTAVGELEEMAQRYSQWLPGEEIPEKHWMYRLAKRFWFNDFGAYKRLEASGGVPAASLKTPQKPSGKESAAA